MRRASFSALASRRARVLLSLGSLLAGAQLAPSPRVRFTAAASDGDASCRICHSGPARGLRESPHASLACAECHGDLAEHVAAASRPGQVAARPVPHVAAAACGSCHAGEDYATALAAHALPAAAPAQLSRPDAAVVRAVERAERSSAIHWSGLLDFGYRFVHVAGSRDRYRTDVDLEPGARLRAFELRGVGGGDAVFDDAWVRADDLGDPRWNVEGRVIDAGDYELGGAYRNDTIHYAAEGEFHRVDYHASEASTDFELELGDDVRLFGRFARRTDRGYWLTQRIGNQNVTPQTYVDGVESPRHFAGDETELGLQGDLGDWRWTVAANYRDERTSDRWTYFRPAPANPAFPESEDFTSRTSLRGPGARTRLVGEVAAAVQVDLSAGWYGHDRHITASGDAAGYDVAQFTSDTTAVGDGRAETSFADLGLSLLLDDEFTLRLDTRWRDHGEELQLSQFERSVYPTLSTTVDVSTELEQETSQRLFEAEALLQWSPSAKGGGGGDLDLGVGYGTAHEWLRVPELTPTDPRDYVRGYSRDQGPLAELRWRVAGDWTLRADWRDFGTDGLALYELVPTRERQVRASFGWQRDGQRVQVFARQRQRDNQVSQYSLDSLASGLDLAVRAKDLTLSTTYTFARTDSQTLTSFYFDPDPNPVPTYVGFDGDTHTVVGSVLLQPSQGVQWEFAGAWTKTVGSFDVSTFDLRTDLRVAVGGADSRSDVGLEYRRLTYAEQAATADWQADLVFLYWRSRW